MWLLSRLNLTISGAVAVFHVLLTLKLILTRAQAQQSYSILAMKRPSSVSCLLAWVILTSISLTKWFSSARPIILLVLLPQTVLLDFPSPIPIRKSHLFLVCEWIPLLLVFLQLLLLELLVSLHAQQLH